ncbi:MAG: 50S ribosomal protein L24, partial [Gammaproteobacteria bacterium]
MQKLKSGDEVIVIAGKNKGERGKLMKVLTNGRVMVEGINMVKKHVRPNPNEQ